MIHGRIVNVLTCDECTREFPEFGGGAATMRKIARTVGWRTIKVRGADGYERPRDLCPMCS